MTAPIRIRAKSGEEIDLAELRQIAERGYRNTWPGLRIVILLDALEAALNVSSDVRSGYSDDFDAGRADAIADVRQAAGVVESEAERG